jgi:hypothetical protein
VTFRIDHSLADGTLRITLSGELKHDQLAKLRDEVGELARGAAVRQLLVDVRALHHSIGPIDTLRLIDSYAVEKPAWRTAVLETREQAQAHHFHETAAVNRGYKVLHFTDEAKAQAWLRG